MVLKALVENTTQESFPEMTAKGSLKVQISNEEPIKVSLDTDQIHISGPITIANEVEIKNDSGNPVPVVGPLTNAELRAAPVGVYGAAQRVFSAVAIASGATVSDVMDFSTTALLGFILSAVWTAGTLTIEVSANNSDWATAGITDASGSAVSNWSSTAASGAYSIDVLAMLPYRYARFRSGTAQASAQSITVITRPLA